MMKLLTITHTITLVSTMLILTRTSIPISDRRYDLLRKLESCQTKYDIEDKRCFQFDYSVLATARRSWNEGRHAWKQNYLDGYCQTCVERGSSVRKRYKIHFVLPPSSMLSNTFEYTPHPIVFIQAFSWYINNMDEWVLSLFWIVVNVLVVFPLKIRHGLHLYTCGMVDFNGLICLQQMWSSFFIWGLRFTTGWQCFFHFGHRRKWGFVHTTQQITLRTKFGHRESNPGLLETLHATPYLVALMEKERALRRGNSKTRSRGFIALLPVPSAFSAERSYFSSSFDPSHCKTEWFCQVGSGIVKWTFVP